MTGNLGNWAHMCVRVFVYVLKPGDHVALMDHQLKKTILEQFAEGADSHDKIQTKPNWIYFFNKMYSAV